MTLHNDTKSELYIYLRDIDMDKYEYSDKRICKHNIQRETCRECLFETLCSLEEKKEKKSEQNPNLYRNQK